MDDHTVLGVESIADRVFTFSGRHPRFRPFAARVLNAMQGNRTIVRGRGNRIECGEALLRRVRLIVNGDANVISIGAGARLCNFTIRIAGSGHVLDIGTDCRFKAGTICMSDNNGRLTIGADTTIEQADIAVTEGGRIVIGRDCMLAFGVDMRNGDSHAIVDVRSGARINTAANINIGDHVWVGAHVQVLKGVTVGSGSVVGIRSVVTNAIPAGVVAAGIPAGVLRDGVAWTRAC